MTIQAIFFDMGGTIETFWFTRELRMKATPGLERLLLDAGIALHLSHEQLFTVVTEGLARYHRWRMQTLEELPPQRVWCDYVFAGYPVDAGVLEAIAEDLMLYVETRYYQREMRPEIPSVLEKIKKMGLKIGLISNVCSRSQVFYNLEQYGIRNYFNPIVTSSSYGRRKPDPAIFHYAARQANVPTSQSAYVGDRVTRDISGARRAGFGLAIQIYHAFEHGENDEGDTPDAIIEDMTGLVDILKERQGRTNHSSTASKMSSNHQLRAMLFDAGDILYHRPDRGIKLKTFLSKLQLNPEKVSVFEKKALDDRAFCGQISQDEYREAALRLYGVSRLENIQMGKRILEEEENDVQFYEDVCETLHTLKEKDFLLGVITDTTQPLHVKLDWFEKAGFGSVWDSIISSRDLGIRKPDPAIYQAALRQLGIAASEAAFIGHKTFELDGAKAIGMKTIAFNYDKDAQADDYIEKFSDLLSVAFVTTPQIDLTGS
jgi:putative hydrolase of the HAD superfamily